MDAQLPQTLCFAHEMSRQREQNNENKYALVYITCSRLLCTLMYPNLKSLNEKRNTGCTEVSKKPNKTRSVDIKHHKRKKIVKTEIGSMKALSRH